MNVLLLGAGASKSYDESYTKVRMPIAKDFFRTFNQLSISENRWVLVGDILNYLLRFHNISWQGFIDYNEDIEVIHSEVEQKLNSLLKTNTEIIGDMENNLTLRTYLQLIFVFASVINEIQNGPVSHSHINIAKLLGSDDTIITFNWDTLMDRALKETTTWQPDFGYVITPSKIYKNEWLSPISDYGLKSPTLLKLHGSTNWLTSYLQPAEGKLNSMQETPTDDFYIYESTIHPYSTYDGRFMDGYSDFCYGYYPPNLPLLGQKPRKGYSFATIKMTEPGFPKGKGPSNGLPSMPLIIPPVKNKDYSHFGSLFSVLWKRAEESLINAERIIIIGYSFPITDVQTDTLFKIAFSQRITMPQIFIVDPNPENIVDRFIFSYGIKSDYIKTFKCYFNSEFEVEKLFK